MSGERLLTTSPASVGKTVVMVHRSAADGYKRRAETYASARPSYHSAVVDRFAVLYGRGVVVEIGAGSGIFTRQLVDRGIDVSAIEPVAEMRAELHATLPHLEALAGTAEDTGLADQSVDTLVVAQAFHWFDHAAALAEAARILRPGGHLVCVWNVRDDRVPWMRAYTEIVDRHAGDTPRHRTMRWRDAIDADQRFRLADDIGIDNPVPASPDAVSQRALSTSFIAALDQSRQAAVLAEIGSLTQPLGDRFDVAYRTELQAWRHEPKGPESLQ